MSKDGAGKAVEKTRPRLCEREMILCNVPGAEEVNLNARLQGYITFRQVLVMVVQQKIMINFGHGGLVSFPSSQR